MLFNFSLQLESVKYLETIINIYNATELILGDELSSIEDRTQWSLVCSFVLYKYLSLLHYLILSKKF